MEKVTYFFETKLNPQYPIGANHMDGFPDEISEIVHDHWKNFAPQHPIIVPIFGLLFCILTFVSFFGNGLVIFIFSTTPSLRSPVSILNLYACT